MAQFSICAGCIFALAILAYVLQTSLLLSHFKSSGQSAPQFPPSIPEIQYIANREFIAKAHSSNTSLLDIWLKSWTDPSLLAISPMGDILPEILAVLDKRQNPPNCSEASFLVLDPSRRAGFGSVVKSVITGFHLAVRTNRVFLVDSRRPFFWTKGCDNISREGQLECFFQAQSRKCSYKRVSELLHRGKLREVKVADQPDGFTPNIPTADAAEPNVAFLSRTRRSGFNNQIYRFQEHSDFLVSIAPNISSHARRRHLQTISSSRRVWTTALVYYLLRLRSTTARHIQSQLQKILKTDNPNYSQLLGLPIRASDKCKNNSFGSKGEMNCVSLSEIMDRVQRVAFAAPGITHAIVTSEDSSAITEEKIHAAQTEIHVKKPLQVIRNHLDVPPETGSVRMNKSIGTPADLLKASLVTMHLQSLA